MSGLSISNFSMTFNGEQFVQQKNLFQKSFACQCGCYFAINNCSLNGREQTFNHTAYMRVLMRFK